MDALLQFIEAVLDSDHGINEKAWGHLNDMAESDLFTENQKGWIKILLGKAKATDGYYYLPLEK